jgi:hypothetical protein
MKPINISAHAAATVLTLSIVLAGVARAQGSADRPLQKNPGPVSKGWSTQIQQKQRDSAGPRPGPESSGVRARQKPNATAAGPDTSYHTITNAPPESGTNTNTGASGTAPAINPSGPRSSRTTGQAKPVSALPHAQGKTALPESMQIQQQTERALPPRRDLITKGGGATGAPSVVNSSVERNRLDSSAPSRQRLQIDDLSGVRAQQQNPDNGATTLSNPIPASNGASSGTSGLSVAPARSGATGGTAGAGGRSSAPSNASHSSAGSSSSSSGGH